MTNDSRTAWGSSHRLWVEILRSQKMSRQEEVSGKETSAADRMEKQKKGCIRDGDKTAT